MDIILSVKMVPFFFFFFTSYKVLTDIFFFNCACTLLLPTISKLQLKWYGVRQEVISLKTFKATEFNNPYKI